MWPASFRSELTGSVDAVLEMSRVEWVLYCSAQEHFRS
jgi:hypothetical protein